MELWLQGKAMWSRGVDEDTGQPDGLWEKMDHHKDRDCTPDFDDDQEFSLVSPEFEGIKSRDMFPACFRTNGKRHLVVAMLQDNDEHPFCFQDQDDGIKYSKDVLYLGDKIDPKTLELNWDSVLKQFQGTKPDSGKSAKGLLGKPHVYFTPNSAWYELVNELASFENNSKVGRVNCTLKPPVNRKFLNIEIAAEIEEKSNG